jgi:hypothetical protein
MGLVYFSTFVYILLSFSVSITEMKYFTVLWHRFKTHKKSTDFEILMKKICQTKSPRLLSVFVNSKNKSRSMAEKPYSNS